MECLMDMLAHVYIALSGTLLPVCVNYLQKNNLEVTPCFEDNDIILNAGCDFQIMVDAILKCASHLHVTLYQE